MGLGLVGKVLSFIRTSQNDAKVTEVKADAGGGYNLTPIHMASPGDDSHPLAGDYVGIVPGVGSGQFLALGYADPASTPAAAAGEKRLYARDPATGAPVCVVWLKNDGSVVIDNGAGTIELEAAGDVVINGVTISAGGDITMAGDIDAATVTADSVIADGKELVDHTHLAGTPPGTTGPNQ